MNAILKAVIIFFGGALTLLFTGLALRDASLVYAIQAAAALLATFTLLKGVSKKNAVAKQQNTRNQKIIAIGLVIGLLAPALILWLLVRNAHGT